MRHDAALPEADAAADHVPASALMPPEAGLIHDAGRLIVHKRPAGSGAAQFAGSDPLNIFKTADDPIVACI